MARETRDVWAKRVERWNESGLTGGQFAAELGVKEATLRHWKWALERESREPGWEARVARRRRARTTGFVEVVATPNVAEASTEALEIVVRGDIRIRVPPRFDATLLRRVIEAIEDG